MSAALSIDRMTNRYRLPAEAAGPFGRSDLDRLAVAKMAPRLEERLPALLEAAGHGRDSVVLLAEIHVRVTLQDSAVDPDVLAAAWAEAIEQGFMAQLPGGSAATPDAEVGASRGARIGEDVAVFDDLFAAERTWLREIARGQPEAWWWRPLLAEGGSLPRVGSVLARWVYRDPARAIAEMASLLRTDGARLGRLLDPATAQLLLRDLAARRARRLQELTLRTDTTSSLRLLEPQLLASLDDEDRRALLTAPHTEARRLYALLLCLDRQPSCHIESVRQLDALGDYLMPTSADELDPGVARTDRVQATANGSPVQNLDEVPVSCGGLLYLIRPLARTELVDPRRTDLDRRLLALGSMILETALSGLPAADRDEATAAELPLLAVFAGRREVSVEDLADVHDLEPTETAATLAWLTAAIPESIQLCAGAPPRPRPSNPLARRLARLVQRPGRLALTPTHADLTMSLDSIDPALRRAAWDADPGWVPYLGRVIRFHFVAS